MEASARRWPSPLLVVLLLAAQWGRPANSVAVGGAQQIALQALRRSLAPAPSTALRSWWSKNECADWLGLTCDKFGNVVHLILTTRPIPLLGGSVIPATLDGPLEGTLPEGTAKLTYLKRLMLYGLNLKGGIPNDIGNLKDLEFLSLGKNELSGGLPYSLRLLTKLSFLDLSSNQEVDSASQKKLTGNVSFTIPRLTNLRYLNLHNNAFFGILSGLKALTKLEYLDLSANLFRGALSQFLGNFPNLNTLYLYENSFSGVLPNIIGTYKNLKTLDCSFCGLDGNISEAFGNLQRLEKLNLQNNALRGSIPYGLVNLPMLKSLVLRQNKLSGYIPYRFSKLAPLDYVSCEQNGLTGFIPAWVLNSKEVYLYQNSLFGRLPAIGPNLKILFVGQNYLSGEAQLPDRDILDVSNNYLSSIAFNAGGAFADGNCLALSSEFGQQRSAAQCGKFCSARQPGGACGKRGTCVPRVGARPVCFCQRGYYTAVHKFTCTHAPSPPPPLKRKSPPRAS